MEYWFNTTFNASTKFTPFRIVCGRDPPALYRFQDSPSTVAAVEDITLHNAMLDLLKSHLLLAQQRMKKFADNHKRELSFEIGEMVMLKLWPNRLKSLARCVNEKLISRFYGPFKVLESIGPMVLEAT